MKTLIRDNPGRIAFSRARAAVFVSFRTPIYFYNLAAPDGWAQGRPLVVAGTLGDVRRLALTPAVLALVMADEIRRRCADDEIDFLRRQIDVAAEMPQSAPYSGELRHVSDCLSEAHFYLDATQRERDAEHRPLGEAGG
jgi:hypothetical protein